MKSNELKELDYYMAEVAQYDENGNGLRSWGFCVWKEGRNVFTVKLANELIDTANQKYKEKFGKDVDFNWIKLDMSKYYIDEDYVLDDGITHPSHIVGKKRIGKYDKRRNILRIFEDDLPVYENNNGKIYRDACALADSLM